MRASQPAPVHNHAELRQRKRSESANREERDETVRDAAKGYQQPPRQ